MAQMIKMPGPDGVMQALTTLKGAGEYMDIPASSIKYYLMRGDLRWIHMGPYRLIDAEKAKVVLQKTGYKRRKRIDSQ